MSTAENIEFINKSIQENGATHILDINVKDINISKGERDMLYYALRNYITSANGQNIELAGNWHRIYWYTTGYNSVYTWSFYTCYPSLPDIPFLTHVKKMLIQGLKSVYENKSINITNTTEIAYSIKKTMPGPFDHMNVDQAISN